MSVKWIILCLFIMSTFSVFADTDPASLYRDDTRPVVYTGIATLTVDPVVGPAKFITRLHLIRTGLSANNEPTYRATLVLHLSSDASNEYMTMNYPNVNLNPGQRRITLTSGQLPVVGIEFDESLKSGKARFISQARDVGTVDFTNGWDYPRDQIVEQNYGGIYDATCPVVRLDSAGSYHMKQVIIVPNRMNQNIQDPNPMYNDMGYIASANCDTIGDETCHTFSSGRVMLMEKELVLFEGANAWNCKRLAPGKLTCTSPAEDCNLTKTREIHSPYTEISKLPFAPIELAAVVPVIPVSAIVTDPDCTKWNGRKFGILHHRLGERMQPVDLQFASWSELDDQGKPRCAVNIEADMMFYTYSPIKEHILYPFPTIYLTSTDDRIIVNSVSPNEISLELWKDNASGIHGNWISNIAGYVGPIEFVGAENYSALPHPNIDRAVFGLSGDYTETLHQQISFSLRAYPRSKDTNYHSNPYYSNELEGGMKLFFDLPPIAVNRAAYYDFYTNFLAVTVGAGINIGQLDCATNSVNVLNFSMSRHARQGTAFDHTTIFARSTQPN